MNVQDLGSIGELVSSLVVLVTLIYFAVQLRETRKALMAQAYQARTIAQQDALLRVAENEGLSAIIAKVQPERGSPFDIDAVDDLSVLERRRLAAFHQALALRHDNTAFQHLAGYISKEDIIELMDGLPILLPLWKQLGVTIQPALRRYMRANAITTEGLRR